MKNYFLLLSVLLCYVLNVQCQICDVPVPGALNCDEAFPPLCDINDLDGFCSSLPDFPNPSGPSPLCNTSHAKPDNCIWFKFQAGTKCMSLTITPSNCKDKNGQSGIEAVIYSGSGCEDLVPLVCNTDCLNTPIDLNSCDFVPGGIYSILIDGCNGSVCDFTVDVIEGGPLVMGNLDNIEGSKKVCKGSAFNYSVNNVNGALLYFWTMDGILLNDPQQEDNQISVTFDAIGVHHLCVDVANVCMDVSMPPAQRCIDITVGAPPVGINPAPVKICNNATYTYDGKGYGAGTHTVALQSYRGCDSVVILTVNEAPKISSDIGTFYKCKADCITIQDAYGHGGQYCDNVENGNVILQAVNGCDSIINYTLRKQEVDANIDKPSNLNCFFKEVQLDGSSSSIKNSVNTQVKWLDKTGNILSYSLKVNVNEPGEYCLTIIGEAPNGLICYDTSCTTVKFGELDLGLQLNTTDNTLSCGQDTVCLNSSYTGPINNFHWEGPGNVFVPGRNICVTQLGSYQLIAEAFAGCSDTLTVDIVSDYNHTSSVDNNLTICHGDTLTLNNEQITMAGNYVYKTQSNDTCFTYTYHVAFENSFETTAHFCQGESITIKDSVITVPGLYTIPFNTQTTCDSVYIVNVIQDPLETTQLDITVKKGAIYSGHLITSDTVITNVYKNQYGCDSTVVANIHVTTATLSQDNEAGIKLVPNPAKSMISIVSQKAIEYNSYEIYNSLGQIVNRSDQKSSLPVQLDISAWSPGWYLLKLRLERGVMEKSFIKQE